MTSKIIVNTIEADTGISSITFASDINLQNDASVLVSSNGVRLGTGSTIAAPSANEITLSTNGTERVRVTSTGLFGIGTNNPEQHIHVKASYGTIEVENTNTAQYAGAYLTLKGPAGTERSTILSHGNLNTGGTESYFSIEQNDSSGGYVKTLAEYNYQNDYWSFNTGGTEKLRITSGGNIGIGTDNPQEDLHIGSNSPYILLDDYDNNYKWKLKGTAWFAIEDTTAGEDRLRILSDGKVGIGTDSPAYDLDLGESPSTIRLVSENNGTAIRIGAGDNGNSDVTLLRVDGGSGQHDGESDSSAYGFSIKYMGTRSGNNNSLSIFGDDVTAGTQVEAITINQDGSTGIGTDNPTEKLEIRDGGLLINGSNLTGILTEDVLDDTFVSIDLTQPGFIPGGLFLITTVSGGTNPTVFPQPTGTGLVYYDCGNSLLGARILADADTGSALLVGGTTSTSTTITDFTDGRVTIICNTNTLRIANRTGGIRRFKLTFV